MRQLKVIHFTVGILMLLGIAAFIMLSFKVSGLTSLSAGPAYRVKAEFGNIGGLKIRAPVTIAGVRVGEVEAIELEPDSLNANVVLRLDAKQDRIPAIDTEARILTEGLLGSNYISLTPGFVHVEGDDGEPLGTAQYLKDGDTITKTQEAMILENLIGQLLFNINK